MSSSWKPCNTHVYQALPSSILWCASLRGEEVVIFKTVLRPFFVDGRHGNTKKYTCVPSFTFMHCMVSKFEM